MLPALENFKTQIRNLYEVEIGDFKRKSLLYLNRFGESFQNPSSRHWMEETRNLILCNQTTEVDVLRNQILEKAKEFK